MQSTNDIRKAFQDFFSGHDHEAVASGPLVPHNDPTLLFTNAGMVQFKNVFTGVEKRARLRATTSQKCVRAGGKHNDLDNVGYTARHHTFFEMLGNFSFGDYFKDLAIELAWTLLTKEYGLPADRLLITVYHTDDHAFSAWKKITGFPDERIIRIATSDNFWSMGETGPCGPCSEIFFDHGPGIPGGPPGSADEDGDRFIEIWNLVFMQFEQLSTGERIDLPRPSIDTGMGLERLAAVLQGKHDNYDIDLFRRLIEASGEAAGTAPDGPHRVSHRVIADHLRASSFLLADGVMPSNEGRGYVLRRIMRRAMRHANMMNVREPLMWRLVPTLIAEMGQAFPELVRGEALITETLKLEEARFQETLGRGLRLLEEASDGLATGDTLPGDVAFKLYDTYGFPLDLTQDALRARGVLVDTDGFDTAMARQKAEARKSWSGSGERATDDLWFGVRDKAGPTEFLGYETVAGEAQVVALVKDGAALETAGPGDRVAIIANQTPFYGESGGQVGDTGTISGKGARLNVESTSRVVGDVHVHHAIVVEGSIAVGDLLHFEVDVDRRDAIRRNHSATHLLHAALRRHLGNHVTQKGSLVAPDRLRFDVSHPKALTDREISEIEADVNREIIANTAARTLLMSPTEAVEKGAMALFGEKYGDEVRVVSMGRESTGEPPYSVELCGGTHVTRTGDIGLFKIIGEAAVAAGVRRIEAVTGDGAIAFVNEQGRQLHDASALLKVAPAGLGERVAAIIAERKKLERELTEARRALASGSTAASGGDKEIAGITFAARKLDGVPAKDLRGMADALKKKIGSGVVALVAVNDGKAASVVAVTEDLVATYDARELVKAGVAALGGKGGGGRPDMAQGGGPDAAKAEEALVEIEKALTGAARPS